MLQEDLPLSFELRFEEQTGAHREPYLVWFGGVIGVLLVLAAFVGIASFDSLMDADGSVLALAANAPADSPQLGDRVSCVDIGRTDLRSAPEGLWFEANCI